MTSQIELLISQARALKSPYADEEARVGQISEMASLLEKALELLKEEVAKREALEAALKGGS